MKVSAKSVLYRCALCVLVYGSAAPVAADEVISSPSIVEAKGEGSHLSYLDYLGLVLANNPTLKKQELEWGIASSVVMNAESEFEPVLTVKLSRDDNFRRLATIDASSLGGLVDVNDEYRSASESASVEVNKKFKTGVFLTLTHTMERQDNDSQVDPWKGEEHISYGGMDLVVPLLKGAGTAVNSATVRIAEMDKNLAKLDYLKEAVDVSYRAVTEYLNLYLAVERLSTRHNSEKIATQLLEDQKGRYKLGKGSIGDVKDGKIGLVMRQTEVSQAIQLKADSMDKLRYLMGAASPQLPKEFTVESFDLAEIPEMNEELVAHALQKLPQYLALQKKSEREGVRLVHAENQRYPRLDFKASYGLNALGTSYEGAYEQLGDAKYDRTSIGFEFSIPLEGDKRSRSELSAAKMKKQQVMQEINTVEMEAANSIRSAIFRMKQAWSQYQELKVVEKESKELFDLEMQKLKSGRSNIRTVLEREGRYNQVLESVLEAKVNYHKAVFALEYADGSMMERLDANFSNPLEKEWGLTK
jgi:outer membrane protein TolC